MGHILLSPSKLSNTCILTALYVLGRITAWPKIMTLIACTGLMPMPVKGCDIGEYV